MTPLEQQELDHIKAELAQNTSMMLKFKKRDELWRTVIGNTIIPVFQKMNLDILAAMDKASAEAEKILVGDGK